MTNQLQQFLEKHPDSKSIIGLYLEAWEEEYGEGFIMDVAETREESERLYKYYSGKGFKLLDENSFGYGFETMGIVSCWKIPK